MAKKKAVQKKKGNKLSEGEREMLKTDIRFLEAKLVRLEGECQRTEDAIEEHEAKYEKQHQDKEQMIDQLTRIITDAKNIRNLTSEALEHLVEQQEKQIEDIEKERLTLEAATEAVRVFYTKKIQETNKKMRALERFESEIPVINQFIESTEGKLGELKDKYKQKIEEETKEAVEQMAIIRNQVLPLLLDKEAVFRELFLNSVDPAYTSVIAESYRLRDVQDAVSKRIETLDSSSKEAEEKIQDTVKKHRPVREKCKEQTMILKEQRKQISLLEAKIAEHEAEKILLKKLEEKLKKAEKTKLKIQSWIPEVKSQMERSRADLEQKETAIHSQERQLSQANEAFRELQLVVRAARELIRQEVAVPFSERDPEDATMLERLNALFTTWIDELPDISNVTSWNQAVTSPPRKQKEIQVHTYTIGDLNLVNPRRVNKTHKDCHKPKSKDASVQTDAKTPFDMVSARILVDFGLFNKFEKQTKLTGQRLNKRS